MTRTRASVALLVATAALGIACRHDTPYQKPRPVVRVEPATAGPASAGGIRYSASVEPRARVDLAFRVGGYVASVAQVAGRPLQEGDRVAKGSVVATLRDTEYAQRVAQARAQLAQAAAAVEQTRNAFERAKALRGERGLTLPDFESAQLAAETATARRDAAQAALEEAQLAVADTILRAPIDGTVLKRLLEPGSLVGPGTPVLAIADTSEVRVAFGAADVLLPRLSAGAPQAVTTEAYPGEEFTGRIISIAPNADPRSRVFDVRIAIPNRDGRLKPGMVASLRLHEGSAAAAAPAPGVALPLGAVVRPPDATDAYAVYVVEGNGDAARVRLRRVTLGAALGQRVTVTTGLAAGELVVVQGAPFVTDGEPVSVIR